MKKTILSSLLAFTLLSTLGTSSAFADDTTSLTKAVVKVITNQHALEEKFAQINTQSSVLDTTVSDTKKVLDQSNIDIETSKKDIINIKSINDAQAAKIADLEKSLSATKADLDVASKKVIDLEASIKNVSAEDFNKAQSVNKEQIDSLKVVTSAEIDMIKARIEREKPIYVIQDGAKKGDCKANDPMTKENSDKVIESFIKE
jgi:septal ring factor EnvC (AmiA/AmiB activator)